MLCDWHVQVCMLDYDVDPEKGKKVLAQLCDKLETHFGVWNASFTLTDCGVISDIFEAKIQSNLEGYWDEFFDKKHSFFVTAINTQLDEPLTWRIERGECTFDYSTYFVDAYGNDCELDTTKVVLFGTAGKERIFVCPVKKMIETGESDPEDCFKVPALFENLYDEEDISTDEFCDFLQIPECGMYGELGGYLLDKDGKRITALKDFDHSEPDEDGNVYYPVPQSDFVDGDKFKPLTPEATAKWKAKLGL